ncbi:hypothetical protein LTR09_002698 [Extremus antarcticus]|uniref:DUF8212 domain-containing protein n=1 Tax=Extremus antarcticus TaxID=702011 RepID=A0AAJ0GEV7_9PEZI|nr:hypothetical protein LTR09_002698 [Extremus antarcticus]
MAYCLLGIFDVNMPLLYGEGAKSFMRLQLEILRKSSDESIFAWRDDLPGSGLLATTPKAFSDSGDIVQVEVNRYDRLPYCMTNQGLELRLPVESPQDEQPWYYDDPSAPSSRRPEPYFDINFARTSNDRMGMPIPHNGYDPVRFERRSQGPIDSQYKTFYLACGSAHNESEFSQKQKTRHAEKRVVCIEMQLRDSTWQRVNCNTIDLVDGYRHVKSSVYAIYYVPQQGL